MKIISGGQTGVDRGALDAALALEIPHGGCCPKGRLAEDGPIPAKYQLQETDSADYAVRTERNVLESDATLILCRWGRSPSFRRKNGTIPFRRLTGGTLLTKRLCEEYRKPHRVINLNRPPSKKTILEWLKKSNVQILNVAGPRESQYPGVQRQCREFLVALFTAESRISPAGG
jgi:hypothetical protein